MSYYHKDAQDNEQDNEQDSRTLPNIEVFEATPSDCADWNAGLIADDYHYAPGWYWWYCLPGCLPDSEPYGPYESEEAALAEARAENT